MLSRPGRRNLSPRCSGSGFGLHSPRRPAEGDNARGLGPGHSWQAFGSSRPGGALVWEECRPLCTPKVARFPQDPLGGDPAGEKLREKLGGAACRGLSAGERRRSRARKSLTEFVLCVVGKELQGLELVGGFFFTAEPRSLVFVLDVGVWFMVLSTILVKLSHQLCGG